MTHNAKRKTQNAKRTEQIILALDVDTMEEARNFVHALFPKIKIFKIGIHLFTAYGPEIVEMVQEAGAEVFLDLKFFDIPHAVSSAVRQAVHLKVKMLTMHILGDEDMLHGAVSAAREESKLRSVVPPLLIGVTVLTSKDTASADVLTLAKMGIECGLDGVVCSVREAALLRKEIQKDFIIVTPGIRPAGVASDDQRRTATIEEARKAGSDYLVVGRPILKAKDPAAALDALLES